MTPTKAAVKPNTQCIAVQPWKIYHNFKKKNYVILWKIKSKCIAENVLNLNFAVEQLDFLSQLGFVEDEKHLEGVLHVPAEARCWDNESTDGKPEHKHGIVNMFCLKDNDKW